MVTPDSEQGWWSFLLIARDISQLHIDIGDRQVYLPNLAGQPEFRETLDDAVIEARKLAHFHTSPEIREAIWETEAAMYRRLGVGEHPEGPGTGCEPMA